MPAPYRYLVEGSLDGRAWFPPVDRSLSGLERHITHDVCPMPQLARLVRLTILEAPAGMRVGAWESMVFAAAPRLQ